MKAAKLLYIPAALLAAAVLALGGAAAAVPVAAPIGVTVGSVVAAPDSSRAVALLQPEGLAMDGNGVPYIADTGNGVVRKFSEGRLTTVAGRAAVRDAYGLSAPDFQDGAGTAARFYRPGRLAFSGAQLYVSDTGNHSIRVVRGGETQTLCGVSSPGYIEGKGTSARFNTPGGITPDGAGGLFVADTLNHCIRRVSRDGTVSLYAGTPGAAGFADGAALSAAFNEPMDVALGSDGALYVADSGNQRIRRVGGGAVTTFAGGGSEALPDAPYLAGGFKDGVGGAARFYFPSGLCAGPDWELYVADTLNHAVRRVSAAGEVSTLAGGSDAGYRDGEGNSALFNEPSALCYRDGALYVADTLNSAVRIIRLPRQQEAK